MNLYPKIQIYRMTNTEINTECRILQTACDIFLLYGYHGTTLRQIAIEGGVNKASINYYFRSKDRLYINVVDSILNPIFNPGEGSGKDYTGFDKTAWFLTTELYNNGSLFEKALKVLYPTDWAEKLKGIRTWLESK